MIELFLSLELSQCIQGPEIPPYVANPPVEVLVLPSDPPLPDLEFCGYDVEGRKMCCGGTFSP